MSGPVEGPEAASLRILPLFDVASLNERVQKGVHRLFHTVKIVRIICFQRIPETAQSIIRIVDLISAGDGPRSWERARHG